MLVLLAERADTRNYTGERLRENQRLAVDPGLQDGEGVEVVNRGSNNRERGALLISCFLEIPHGPIKA